MEKPTDKIKEWEWIDRYWTGKLSATEAIAFEKKLQEDPEFAREAAALREGVQLLENARLDHSVRQHLQKIKGNDRLRRLQIRRVAIFGAILAAACVAFMVFLSYSPVQLPGQENDLDVVRDLRNLYEKDTTQLLTAHRKKAFDAFYEGQSFWAEGRPELAAQRFEQVLTFENLRPYFLEATQWHLVLCYLKTNQLDRANYYYERVREPKEYDIKTMERWKVWWQLKRAQW